MTLRSYVADHRQYLPDGRVRATSGGWQVMVWDEMRSLWEEGSLHRTKRQAQAALAEWRNPGVERS